MAKIVLDLHDIYNKGFTIDAELNRVIVEAIEKVIERQSWKGVGTAEETCLTILATAGSKKTLSSAGEGRQEFWKGFRTSQTLGYKHFTFAC